MSTDPRSADEPSPESQGKPAPLLKVENLEAWYGESHILHGVTFSALAGQVVTLIGRNGAGKTTTLKSLIGLVRKRKGSVIYDGVETIGMRSREIAVRGVGYVPEERGIFTSLTVQENLFLPPAVKPGGLALDRIFELFPNLRTRLGNPGGKLSGGEQQMLAIARILRTGATTLLLDEPTEGLAPVIVEQIRATMDELKRLSFTIILVEQNLRFASEVADRHFVLEQGQVVDMIDHDRLASSYEKLKNYIGV